MNREYHHWFSRHLGREMELLVFGHAGAKVLVFPTREGRFYDYEDWGLVRAASEKIEAGSLQLFCVDSVDAESFYNTVIPPSARIARHKQYENYLLWDVIPFMRSRGRQPFLIAHGCSIGAFHAVNLALRRPGIFGKVVALSGRYDLTEQIGPFRNLFDGYYDNEVYFNTPTHFLPSLHNHQQLEALRKTEIILAVGVDDPFRQSTEKLSYQLWDKQIWNALKLWEGEAHRPRYWRKMVQEYL